MTAVPGELVIVCAPGYAPRFTLDTVRAAEALDADSIGYTEAYKVAATLGATTSRYRSFVGKSDVDTRAVTSMRGDAGDNPVSVLRGRGAVGQAYRIDGPGRPAKYAPERWLTMAAYRWNGRRVVHINLHPSPRFCGWRKWRKAIRRGTAEVERALAAGRIVVLTGDLQSRRATRLLKESGLKVWRVGVCFIAYSPDLHLADQEVHRVAGMDHPWMVATFVGARP